MDALPYQVYSTAGQLVLQAAETCRYPRALEAALLDAGYTIKLSGKRLTRAEVRKASKESDISYARR